MTKKLATDEPIHVLTIGTKILTKDVMDLYLRGLGDVKTYFASRLSLGVESFLQRRPSVVFCEHSFPEGSAAEFVDLVGGLSPGNRHYFVLAAENASQDLEALGTELGIDEILLKPFSADDVYQLMSNFMEKRRRQEPEWVSEICVARTSFFEKRFQEAEELFASAMRKHWQNSPAVLEGATFFLARNQPQAALPLVEKVLTESPDSARALHLHGCALRRLGRFQEAAQAFLKAAKISPANSVRNVELAETYVAMADEQIAQALRAEYESSALLMRKIQYMMFRKEYGALVTFIDSKRDFLSEAARKEADALATAAKKLGGLR